MEVVGCYARLSRLKGRDENIDTQHRLQVDLAQTKHPGCQIRLYADPDASAEDEDVYRPDYERLKTDLAAGTLTQVVTSDQERLTRRPDELERLITVFRNAGVAGFWGYRDGWTSVVAGQSAGARYKGVGAKEYVEGIKVKVNEKLDALAAAGRPGGGHCYGYTHGTDPDTRQKTLEIDETRAAHVRWAAECVLAGWSLSAVARELEARGAKTLQGGRWSHSNVRGMLIAPTVAGFRVKAGRIVRRGNWDPILDEVTWRRLCTLLASPRKVRRPDGTVQKIGSRRPPGRRYLLTGGLAVCGRDGCGAPLVARRRANAKGVKVPMYFCDRVQSDGRGCGKLAVTAEPFERHVADRLLTRLASSEFRARLSADETAAQREALVAKLNAVEAKRRRLAREWAADEKTDAEWDEAREVLDARHAALSAELAGLAPLDELDPDAIVAGWEDMTLDERRQQVRLYLARVVVAPATPGAKRFDPSRVRVVATDGEML